jgi:hypothetical protein
MTDRHSGYIVILEKDIREDDAESTLNALRMVKGVSSVEPIISGISIHIAEQRARTDLLGKIYEFLRDLNR